MSIYVIYHKETTIMYPDHNSRYATRAAAKGVITKAVNSGKIVDGEKYDVAEISNFNENIEKKMERVNMMSGKKYMESVNTPVYMSPSCESYWSA